MQNKIRCCLLLLWGITTGAQALELKPLSSGGAYQSVQFKGVDYGIFQADPAKVTLHWRDKNGNDYRRLGPLRRELERQGKTISMLMNAGIYTQKDYPAGLWIEEGQELKKLNTLDGKGNFHIQPNGVFFIENDKAQIRTTAAYQRGKYTPRLAVQSGPILLRNGKINSRFVKDLSSPYKRNAVCTTQNGDLYFILTESYSTGSEWPSFYRFAEALLSFGCYQGLYLDGSISAWYIPQVSSTFHWTHFVGIIAVTQPKTE